MKGSDVDKLDIITRHAKEHLTWGPKGKNRLRFIALALCGEAGELANYVKKDWRGDAGAKKRKPMIRKELADIANYCFLGAAEMGFDLLTVMVKKLHEVEKRHAFKRRKRSKG